MQHCKNIMKSYATNRKFVLISALEFTFHYIYNTNFKFVGIAWDSGKSEMPGRRATLRPAVSLCKEGGVAASRGIYPDESVR